MSRFRPSRNYVSGEFVVTGGPVDIEGDLVVSGTITANEYNVNVINTNVTHIDADGNTKFGDTPDDTHQFTGSVFIDGPLSASSIVGGGATTPGAPLTSVQYNDGGAFAGDANFTWNDTTSALTITGDITASANVSGAFFYGDGSGLTGVTATAAPAGSNTEIQFNADGVTAADADLVWLTGSNSLTVTGNITASSNISGAFFYGDGSGLTNLPSAAITTYDTPGDDRIVTSVDATTGQGEASLTFDGTTLAVTGDISGSGNVSGSDFYGGGSNLTDLNASNISAGTLDNSHLPATISVTNITASNLVSASLFYGDGSNLTNVATDPAGLNTEIQFNDGGAFGADSDFVWDKTANQLSITGDISASVNISGSAFYGNGTNLTDLNASNISAGTLDNVRLPATISVTNVTASTLVSASSFYGDGSNLTGIAAGSDTQVQYKEAGKFASDTEFTWDKLNNILTLGGVSGSGNISGSDFYGGGANLTDLNASNISAGTLDNARLPATISVTNVTASSLVSASFLYGDGSNLTNLPAGSPGGLDTQIQFNDGGVFNGDAEFTWNKTTDTLTVTGDISGSGNISGSFFYGDGSNLTNVNASLLVGNSLFVDSVNGNDGTATRGNESLPYLTVGAAITDSLSGDVIYVGPGDYPESGLSLPTGRALLAPAGYTQTSLGITSSATDIIATVDDTWVEGFTIHVPTGSGNAGIRFTGTGGTMQAYSLAYAGDGASGLGDGFVKTGTGKVIGAEVRLAVGGLNSVIRVDQGVMAFESIHVPGATGVIENVAIAEGSGRAQLINFNAGNPNVVNTLTVSGSATAVCLNVNWFNVQNGMNLLQDGVSVEINGGKIEPSTYTVKMDLGTTWTSATSIDLINANIVPTYFFPPSGLDTQFEAFYSQKKGDNYLGAARLLGVDFIAGFPEKGAGLMAGKGASYGINTKVYTSDGTDTSTTVGNVTDVSTTASSLADSTFTFEGGAVDHCIYYGSLRKTSDGELVKNFGTLVDTTVGSLTGAYAFEIWNGTAWTDIDYMCTSLGEGYRYANNPFMRSSSKEFTRLGTTPSTTWATSSVDGIDAYWSRCRITTSASLPTFERWWLTPSHFMVSAEGVRQSHGSAAWKQTLVGAGNIFGETGGVVTADISVGSGVSPNAWTHNMPNSLLNQNGDAIYTQFALPSGINTSFPLTFKVLYSLDNATGVTTFPTGILSAMPLGVTGVEVADPAGGKVPTARQFDNTETLTSKAAPLALSLSMQPDGAAATDDLSNRIFSIEYESLSIEEYYEDDIIAIRFELDDDGTPNYNVAIWAIIVEGHKFTEGKAI